MLGSWVELSHTLQCLQLFPGLAPAACFWNPLSLFPVFTKQQCIGTHGECPKIILLQACGSGKDLHAPTQHACGPDLPRQTAKADPEGLRYQDVHNCSSTWSLMMAARVPEFNLLLPELGQCCSRKQAQEHTGLPSGPHLTSRLPSLPPSPRVCACTHARV